MGKMRKIEWDTGVAHTLGRWFVRRGQDWNGEEFVGNDDFYVMFFDYQTQMERVIICVGDLESAKSIGWAEYEKEAG